MIACDRAAGVLAGVAGRIGTHSPVGDKQAGGAAAVTPFAGVFASFVQQSQELGKKATDAVAGLLSGQGVEVHDVLIAQQKADTSFQLALQVRNKAVSAYQQLMGMQF